jgi:hypothetical protein
MVVLNEGTRSEALARIVRKGHRGRTNVFLESGPRKISWTAASVSRSIALGACRIEQRSSGTRSGPTGEEKLKANLIKNENPALSKQRSSEADKLTLAGGEVRSSFRDSAIEPAVLGDEGSTKREKKTISE